MKVIVVKETKGLGKEGAVVEVKPGYARNYLLPKGIVLEANKKNLSVVEYNQKQKQKQFLKDKEKAQEMKTKISGVSVTVSAEVKNKETEEIFGSITATQIYKQLKDEELSIKEEQIILPEPIKKLGIFNVKVRLHPEVEGEIKVWVVKK